jgi:predicted TIM-barrel fold metal-dependent hydrolase
MIVDAHIHLHPLGKLYAADYSLAAYRKLMKRLCIDTAVCIDHISLFEGAAAGLEALSRVYEESEGHIHFLGVFNPNHAKEDLKTLERDCNLPGFSGIKIHPSFHGVPAEHRDYDAVWRFASEHGLPMLTHSWSLSTHNPAQTLSRPERFESYISQYPSVRLILAHAGGRGEGRHEMIRLCNQYENVYTDYAGDIFDLGLLESLVASLPAGRLLFGSDYPWLDPRANLGRCMLADIPDQAKGAVLGLNAVELYGLNVQTK